ncbi:Rossmann-fold NAD(P)-binding domain-containing protein [Epilithonimonas hungarica]|uniref:Lactate dehydrogenase n=1 Tax=Epilithonimonas hungarica TaxID=454006 RepID=A0A1G7QZZ9_9FLAO|nr:hypothetical protein [Epilithonimonas hungarica]MDP9955488.1 hypothetical protein [Epilithonimonas hungarica]MPT30158.1 hypothetical protein [Chryseobacterium sp.]SDG04004.1 hypothetical protein SAMN05421825_2509 [Epilithonimonas hungarica]
MKVIIYNISQDTKKSLALLNRKKHKITIITDPLKDNNMHFSDEKDAVICDETSISPSIVGKLNSFGVKYLILRSMKQLPLQLANSEYHGLKCSKIEIDDSGSEAFQMIKILDAWQAESMT